ncbi:MAG TPA: hydantoinase/oxoprolinase family protein [Acidimicrobiales bacterium]|nr:hydantoinase/oxoprolinase family protein [Acidimicrobiales bacterium]
MTASPASAVLAIDIGGTFTDAALLTADGALVSTKVPTTPGDPAEGFLAAAGRVIDAADISPRAITRVVHGTTLATNVILERRGAPIALITTEGYRSLLALGRHGRVEEERYDLWCTQPEPIVPLNRTFEVRERIGPDGGVMVALDEAHARAVATRIAALGVAGVAVCFLNSYANDRHERAVAAICQDILGPSVAVITSAVVLPEMREFDRMTTTVMSAYVGPVMSQYLAALGVALASIGVHAPVHVMESSGGVMPSALAAAVPVHTIESGPAAGVVAAARVGRDCGLADLISFDMGGTTAKAALVRGGRLDVRHDFIVGGKGSFGGRRSGSGVPVKIPAVDLAEVGSGGGSIAWLDAANTLHVGPRSAGASPGPACYARGGIEPTVTDADLVLGYLSGDAFAGGTSALDTDAAVDAIRRTVAGPLGTPLLDAAFAIHDIANADMAAAIHVVTVQRGIDPRNFALVATGGAAPMHVCRIAERFDIARVVVPPHAGVGSCIGLASTDLLTERSKTRLMELAAADLDQLNALFDELIAVATSDLAVEGPVTATRSVAMRFVGQAHELDVAIGDRPFDEQARRALEHAFLDAYRTAFGIDVRGPIQLVSFRAQVRAPISAVPVEPRSVAGAPPREREAWFPELGGMTPTAVHRRSSLAPGATLAGPVIIEDDDSTVVVPPGWSAAVRAGGTLWLEADVPNGARAAGRDEADQ